MPLFESGAFNHSAISPIVRWRELKIRQPRASRVPFGTRDVLARSHIAHSAISPDYSIFPFEKRRTLHRGAFPLYNEAKLFATIVTEAASTQQAGNAPVTLTATFADPNEIVRLLKVPKNVSVADFGCGSGFFSIAFAKVIGDEGRVYALDILPSVLEAVQSHCQSLGITNVLPKRANLERLQGSGLQDASVDWVIMKDVLFQNKRKEILLAEGYRVLKPQGKLFVMEWSDQDSHMGPEEGVRIGKKDLLELAQKAGFKGHQELPVGNFHYAFLLEK